MSIWLIFNLSYCPYFRGHPLSSTRHAVKPANISVSGILPHKKMSFSPLYINIIFYTLVLLSSLGKPMPCMKKLRLLKRKITDIRFCIDCCPLKNKFLFFLTGNSIHSIFNTHFFFLRGILFFCSGIITHIRDSAYFRDSRYIYNLQ